MPEEKHPVNVLFTKREYTKLVRRATELTLIEGRRVSVAELVRRLVILGDNRLHTELEAPGVGVSSD